MKKFLLLDIRYIVENGETKIELFGKDTNGKDVFATVEYDPYLYIPMGKSAKELEKRISKIGYVKRIEKIKKTLGNEKKNFLKVYTRTHQDLLKIRDELKDEIGHDNFFEYSILPSKKFLMDRQLSPGGWVENHGEKLKNTVPSKSKIKKIAIDIETYEEHGKNKITMISIYGEDFKKVLTYKNDSYQDFVEVLKNEKEMLKRFVEIIKEVDPDIIFGYNSDSFDFKIIQERAEENKVKLTLGEDGSRVKFVRRARSSSAKIWGRVHIDLYNFISNILASQLETDVLSLGEVSSEILGDEKIEMSLVEISESWRKGKNLKKLAEYCLKDSELTFKLGNYFLPQIFEISKLINQTPFDTSRMTYSQIVEWYLSKRACEKNMIIPNQPRYEEIERRRKKYVYTGGFVKEPKEGLHENLAVLDFKSLYPTIIATHNISPETLDCSCCKGENIPGLKHHFCKKNEGFIPMIIKELINERNEIKKKLKRDESLKREEQALKIIANATYGYLAYPGSKWYCFECAESAAAYGRFYIKKVIEEAEKEKFDVVYGDTDSVFLKSDDIVKKTRKFLRKMNDILPGIMELDLQGIYKRGLFVSTKVGKGAKKKYALIDDRGTLTIRGFETVRRDWCKLAKDMQRKIIKMILEKNDVEEALNFVKKTVEKIKNKNIDLKNLIIYEQLTKPLSEYRQMGPHVIAAKKMMEREIDVSPGSVIMFVLREGSGSISDRAEPFEDDSIEKIDSIYYIDNQIIPTALRVLKVFGITKEQLRGEGKQTGLEKFNKYI